MGQIAATLQDRFGPIESQTALTSIGGVVSNDLIRDTIILIAVGSLGIMLWMTYRFRDIRFGATALVSLLHDVLVVVGLFGELFGLPGWLMDVSPFQHVPQVPVADASVGSALALLAVAAGLVAVGVGGLRRRDVGAA